MEVWVMGLVVALLILISVSLYLLNLCLLLPWARDERPGTSAGLCITLFFLGAVGIVYLFAPYMSHVIHVLVLLILYTVVFIGTLHNTEQIHRFIHSH
jgi:hypothetical protein